MQALLFHIRRPWLLILVILLSIQIHESLGIRLRIGADLPDRKHNIQEFPQEKGNNSGIEKANQGEIRRHSSGRKNRKLTMTTPIFSSPTIAKNEQENKARIKSEGEKVGRKEEILTVNGSSTHEQEPSPAPYPDILDLSGMDYTLARRKPPIHN